MIREHLLEDIDWIERKLENYKYLLEQENYKYLLEHSNDPRVFPHLSKQKLDSIEKSVKRIRGILRLERENLI